MVVPNSRETLYCYTQVIHSYECCDIINISIIIILLVKLFHVPMGKKLRINLKMFLKNMTEVMSEIKILI